MTTFGSVALRCPTLQWNLAQDLDELGPVANARAVEIALIGADLPDPFQLHSIRAAEDRLTLRYHVPSMEECVASHEYLKLKSGDLSAKPLAAADRARVYREYLTRLTTRIAGECLRAEPALREVEVKGVEMLESLRDEGYRELDVVAVRVRAEIIKHLTGQESAADLAKLAHVRIALTREGELRRLESQEDEFPGELVAMRPFEDVANVPVPTTPTPVVPGDAFDQIWLVIWGSVILAMLGAALYLALRDDTVTPPPAAPQVNPAAAVVDQPPPSTTEAAVPSNSLCGVRGRAPEGVSHTAWGRYRCRERRVPVDSAWPACLVRSAYTDETGRGCPGQERCCPR